MSSASATLVAGPVVRMTTGHSEVFKICTILGLVWSSNWGGLGVGWGGGWGGSWAGGGGWRSGG